MRHGCYPRYLHEYSGIPMAKERLGYYLNFYNFERHHQGLDYRKPAELYFGEKLPMDSVNDVDNHGLVPRKVTHIINRGPQVQQQ